MRWQAKSKRRLAAFLVCGVALSACRHQTVGVTPYPDNDSEYAYTAAYPSYDQQPYAPVAQTAPPVPQAYDDYDSQYYYGYAGEQQQYAPPPPPPPVAQQPAQQQQYAPPQPSAPQIYDDYDSQYYYGYAGEQQQYAPPPPPPPVAQQPAQQPKTQQAPPRRSLRPYDSYADDGGNPNDNDAGYYPLYYYE